MAAQEPTFMSQLNAADCWYLVWKKNPFGTKRDGTPWKSPDAPSNNK